MPDQENLRVLPGGQTPDEMKEAVRNLEACMDQQVALFAMIAKIKREYFLALVREGFTEEQALELSKTLAY